MATSNPGQTLHFWDLPEELRFMIYEFALLDPAVDSGRFRFKPLLAWICRRMREDVTRFYREVSTRKAMLRLLWTPFYTWVRERRAFLRTHTPLNPVQLWSMTVPLTWNTRYRALHLEAWRPVDVTLADKWHIDVPHHELVLKGEFRASSGHERFSIDRMPHWSTVLNFHSRALFIGLYISYVAAFDEARTWLTRMAADAPHPRLHALVFRSIRVHRERYDYAVRQLQERQLVDWERYRRRMSLNLQLSALGYRGWPAQEY